MVIPKSVGLDPVGPLYAPQSGLYFQCAGKPLKGLRRGMLSGGGGEPDLILAVSEGGQRNSWAVIGKTVTNQ